jgi:prepilin-type processing-associated H-X9-DG protein
MERLTTNEQREFTLLHLAAVFVGLGILSGMIFPPTILTGGVREKARRANCLSNLKQLGMAIAMYADADRLGRCPMDGDPPTLLGSLRLLTNQLGSAKVLSCPSDPRARPEADFAKLTTNNISYSYVPNLKWQDAPDSILALDRIYTTAKGSRWRVPGNHKDAGGNILFNDGHVSFQTSLPSDLRDKDGKAIVLSP